MMLKVVDPPLKRGSAPEEGGGARLEVLRRDCGPQWPLPALIVYDFFFFSDADPWTQRLNGLSHPLHPR